jgi:hypothetical protein
MCLSMVCWAIVGASALAQQGATTVQLPTYSFFTVNTTVTVPDRGMAYLGGVNRAASGRNEFGVPLLPFRPFGNVGIGRELNASNMFVTATIHDFDAIDRYLLSVPTQPTAWRLPPALGSSQVAPLQSSLPPRDPNAGASWRLSPSAVGSPPKMSLAEARAERERQRVTRAAEAVDFFQRGQKAEAAGKAGVAKIYYQMAACRATGQLKEQVAARLEAIGHAQTAPNR